MTPEVWRRLRSLHAAGLHLEPRPGGLVHVQPRGAIGPDDRQFLIANRAAVLAALQLEQRVRAMALRWNYASEELAEALAAAAADPAAWLTACEMDEAFAATADRVDHTWPPATFRA